MKKNSSQLRTLSVASSEGALQNTLKKGLLSKVQRKQARINQKIFTNLKIIIVEEE